MGKDKDYCFCLDAVLPCFIFPSLLTVYFVPGENVKWKRCGWIDVWKLYACMRILMKDVILKQIDETTVWVLPLRILFECF